MAEGDATLPCGHRGIAWKPAGSCQLTDRFRQKIAIVKGPFGRKPFTMANYWLSSWGNRSRWRFFGLTMAFFWRNAPAVWRGRIRGWIPVLILRPAPE